MRKFLIIQLFVFLVTSCIAQIIPGDGDTINYRLAGFSVPHDIKADNYKLEIAGGYFTDEKVFAQHISIRKTGQDNRIIQLLPAFAETYTWRITYLKKNTTLKHTQLYHVHSGYIHFIDTQKHRVSVLKNKLPGSKLLIFYDNTRTLRDLNGDPIWYLPNIPGITDSATTVRDLKLTSHGTITFLTAANGYEIDYDGKILWSCPNDGQVSHDSSEFYHHEFTRLPNGHYMVAGNEYIEREIPDATDTARLNRNPQIKHKDGKFYQKVEFGTIIEYDTSKHAVWTWRSSEHLTENDFPGKSSGRRTNLSSHLNSFYFDTPNNLIYISFRNINRILKISYPQGNIIANYGTSFRDGKEKKGNSLFYGQHNVTKETNGNLLLYNNNVVAKMEAYTNSSIIMLKEPLNVNAGDSLQKIWEFSCEIDTLALPYSTSGGGINELNDGSFLACMGSANRVFIVSKRKELLWDALCQWQDLSSESPKWVPQSGYRANAIETDEQIKKMIFK